MFLEVTNYEGNEKRIINMDHITEIFPSGTCCRINIGTGGCTITTTEGYDQVKATLQSMGELRGVH